MAAARQIVYGDAESRLQGLKPQGIACRTSRLNPPVLRAELKLRPTKILASSRIPTSRPSTSSRDDAGRRKRGQFNRRWL